MPLHQLIALTAVAGYCWVLPSYLVRGLCITLVGLVTHAFNLFCPMCTHPQGPDMSPELRCELERLQAFSCTRFAGQRVEPLKPVSFTAYKDALL